MRHRLLHGMESTRSLSLIRDAEVLGPVVVIQSADNQAASVLVHRPTSRRRSRLEAALGFRIQSHPDFTVGHLCNVGLQARRVKG